jgi:hypothetical protein
MTDFDTVTSVSIALSIYDSDPNIGQSVRSILDASFINANGEKLINMSGVAGEFASVYDQHVSILSRLPYRVMVAVLTMYPS